MANDFTEMDFFRDDRLVENLYPYLESLRRDCPVIREHHHGVTMVTGWDEAVEVFNDAKTFSSCISVTGPFPGFPVPLDGDLKGKTVTELIERHRGELPFSDQLPTLDPPTHTNHRSLQRLLDRTTEITISERAHGPANDRRYQYVPTYILRGPTELHLEFALAQGTT
jgi:cytochrome P450